MLNIWLARLVFDSCRHGWNHRCVRPRRIRFDHRIHVTRWTVLVVLWIHSSRRWVELRTYGIGSRPRDRNCRRFCAFDHPFFLPFPSDIRDWAALYHRTRCDDDEANDVECVEEGEADYLILRMAIVCESVFIPIENLCRHGVDAGKSTQLHTCTRWTARLTFDHFT